MMELWGADSCEACNEIREWLSRTPLEWRYVDVATINFEGEIPRLILENGQQIVGLPGIKAYVKNLMRQMGFGGMI